jgi:hypothetical protein
MVKAFIDGPLVDFCRLCRKHTELQESHVLPRMAYKRFAASSKGGAFLDVAEGSRHSRQLKRRWFCCDCEKAFCETETAAWFDSLGDLCNERYDYGEFLRTFAISLSYRYALLELEDGAPPEANRAMLRKPMQIWRDVLLERRTSLGPYTVHGFLETPSSVSNWDPSLGGQTIYCHGLIVVRTGPLIIFGAFAKPRMSASEAACWSASEINAGNKINVVHRETGHPGLTQEMVATLNVVGEYCFNRLNN